MNKSPVLTVDTIIVYDSGEIVLIKRGIDPYKGYWAIPGGHVDYGEKVELAAIREAREETGLDVEITSLLGVYSDPERDPRGHTASVVFICRPIGGNLNADTDAADVIRTERFKELPLAFDHELILSDYYNFTRKQIRK